MLGTGTVCNCLCRHFLQNLSRISLAINDKAYKAVGPPDINGTVRCTPSYCVGVVSCVVTMCMSLQLPAGTWYFDELSRTAAFVLKRVSGASPSGSLLAVPCLVDNGCLPTPTQTAPVVFGYKMYWYVFFIVDKLPCLTRSSRDFVF